MSMSGGDLCHNSIFKKITRVPVMISLLLLRAQQVKAYARKKNHGHQQGEGVGLMGEEGGSWIQVIAPLSGSDTGGGAIHNTQQL